MIDDATFRAECGARLCRWRQHRRMTRAELADAIGTSENAVARFETGMVEMPGYMMARAALVLQVEPRELMPTRVQLMRMVRQ